MTSLSKPKHELFAQLVVRGETARKAYLAAFGAKKGADQSAARLLKSAKVSARIAELRSKVADELLSETILARKGRLKALEDRWKALNQVIAERGKCLGQLNIHGYPIADEQASPTGRPDHIAPAPGASSGLVCLDWRGKSADRAVWKVDTGTLAELRAIEQQTARELGEWDPEPGAGDRGGPAVIVNVAFVSAG